MSLTLSCKLVRVFAMICAVLLQNQAQDSVVLQHEIQHFQSPQSNLLGMADLRRGGLQSSSLARQCELSHRDTCDHELTEH